MEYKDLGLRCLNRLKAILEGRLEQLQQVAADRLDGEERDRLKLAGTLNEVKQQLGLVKGAIARLEKE